jgi:hypothetical protein
VVATLMLRRNADLDNRRDAILCLNLETLK